MVIGVTGKSGVGKSTFARKYAKEHNMSYLDIDSVGHTVLDDADVRKQIKDLFGIDVSSTNRKELGNLVFANRREMAKLSDITYAKMKVIIYDFLKTHKDVVLDWILLPHTEFFKLCDVKYLVVCNEQERINRLMSRDKINIDDIKLRDKASIEYNKDDFDLIIGDD